VIAEELLLFCERVSKITKSERAHRFRLTDAIQPAPPLLHLETTVGQVVVDDVMCVGKVQTRCHALGKNQETSPSPEFVNHRLSPDRCHLSAQGVRGAARLRRNLDQVLNR
jgi:hypothetical protein